MSADRSVLAFRRIVWKHYRAHGRHDLPWRKTKDPYKILVSEMMLQQTQVPRVIEKYMSFLKQFPTPRALARAPLSAVLKEWSGLGYNRRGKYLHDTAKIVVQEHKGDFKKALERPLPGVGPYTKAAVRTFAWNEPHVFIETNIRTALIHTFFPNERKVSDQPLMILLSKVIAKRDPRTWYWALMDYGAHLKKSGVRNNHRSMHYAKQSKFEGSLRQMRGQVLRDLMNGGKGRKEKKWEQALASLARDGLIAKEKGKWQIA